MLSSLVLGIVFGFDDGRTGFVANLYVLNILKFLILSLIALFIYIKVQKHFASKAGAIIEHDLWHSGGVSFIFAKKKKFYFPLWILVPLIVSLLSKGQIFFASLITTNVIVKPAYRLGRKYTNLTDFEYAKIEMSGPFALILLSLILHPIKSQIITDFTLVTTMIAVFSLIPIPKLSGANLLLGSKPFYIFSLVFILLIAILLKFLTSISALILALVAAIIAMFFYMYKYFHKKK